MGSLPNLNELERFGRTLHHDRDLLRREQRIRDHQRETSRERERLSSFLQHQQNHHHHFLQHTPIVGVGASTLPYVGTPAQLPRHHHRHSLTTRRVLRTRSSGATYSVWDDPMIDHMPAFSPLSSRSHRISAVPPYQVQAALAASRRRESMNSSIGANSIRRLLTLNNRNCRHKVPSHVRTKICKNFTFLAIAHGLICSILIPLIGLQGSNSLWHHTEEWIHVGPNIGSMLLSVSFLLTSGMCFMTTRLIRKVGHTILIAFSYVGIFFFLSCHLYPSIYTLIPAYLVLGLTLGPSWVSKMALVVFFACKLSCSQHECNVSSTVDPLDEHKVFCNRDQRVRRLARWFQAAQDLGIIFGAVIASFILACSSSDLNCFALHPSRATMASSHRVNFRTPPPPPLPVNLTTLTRTETSDVDARTNKTDRNHTKILRNSPIFQLPTEITFLDEMYNHNEHGERICGADLCPVWRTTEDQMSNGTFYANFVRESGKSGAMALVIVYLILAIVALTLACLSGRFDNTFRCERVKGMTDTLMFAGPMAYFIGTEQAYMLGDFTKAYVSCSLGLQMVAGALIGMGIMQSIVSCTLSMLLRHTKRIVVIAAGFFFHACLLLVLSRWKPSKDDSALFYVIAAAWGACNAMWETLMFALITLTHTNHVAEVSSPLQALRFLGLGVTFAAHGFLCENPKILILVIVLVLSVPPYAMLEIRLESQRKAQMVSL